MLKSLSHKIYKIINEAFDFNEVKDNDDYEEKAIKAIKEAPLKQIEEFIDINGFNNFFMKRYNVTPVNCNITKISSASKGGLIYSYKLMSLSNLYFEEGLEEKYNDFKAFLDNACEYISFATPAYPNSDREAINDINQLPEPFKNFIKPYISYSDTEALSAVYYVTPDKKIIILDGIYIDDNETYGGTEYYTEDDELIFFIL